MQRIKHWDGFSSIWAEKLGTEKLKDNGCLYYILKVRVRGINPKGLVLPEWNTDIMSSWLVKQLLHENLHVVSFDSELLSEVYGTQTVLYNIKCKWR